MPFDPVDPKQRLPELEEGILQYWRQEGIFHRSIKQRSQGNPDPLEHHPGAPKNLYSFYDGPPFATGLPHYGHLLAGTIKDVIPRYQTMRGNMVERRFGWDCHGLPIENIVEKEQNLKSRKDIEAMGVRAFNDLCRSTVLRYTNEWRTVVERMGRFVDMDNDYRTMDPNFMESIWWVFQQLSEKGLIYEGYKPMHICPRCVTPLSNFEVTQGYKDISDKSACVKFELLEEPGTFVLAWTTTPWTLPGNLFLAVHPKTKYVRVKFEEVVYIVAEALVEGPFTFADRQYELIGKPFLGKELLGKHYKPLFPYFYEQYKDKAFTIVAGDFVTTEEGTGVVHIAPGFGDDDFQVGKQQGVEILQHVSMDGHFVPAVTDFAGMEVKPIDDPSKTDQKIAEYLAKHGLLFGSYSYKHSYPHCWRCDSPLLNYATSSWFVAVEKMKEQLLEANAQTRWVPSHIRDGRFGKWLENARDWAISRNRYWGAPLPIWRQDAKGERTVLGSRDALMARSLMRFTKVTVLRHAESEGNLAPIYQGKTPGTNLTKRGQAQAQHAAAWLAKSTSPDGVSIPVNVIYASPLARAQQTAQAIAKATGAKVVTDDRLREVDFGDYEGTSVDFSDLGLLKEKRAKKIDEASPESIYHFPGMEPRSEVQTRIAAFLHDVLPLHRSEHIAVVTHADPILNARHFFTGEDPVKLSHQPYPKYATPESYYWDHDREAALDLHKDTVDDIVWPGGKTADSVEITLVRHGQTDWNRDGICQGQEGDRALTELGREQAQKTADNLKKKRFDAIITSDLKRATETAHIISKTLNVPVVEELELLRERSVGEWAGKKEDEIMKQYPMVYSDGESGLHHVTPKGGESFSQFVQRGQAAYEYVLKKYPGKKVLVVCHGGTIRALTGFIQNLPYKDALKTVPKNGEATELLVNPLVQRIPEVLDCWFESGAMPYAQQHYPFALHHDELKEPVGFPADFIAEGIDQTRGWFYTLTVLGTALFDVSPFTNCIVNGIVLAEDGRKMSKKLKNYPEPLDVVHEHGADAVRFTLMSSPAVRGEDLRFSETLVQETVRNMLLPLWNAYSFFVTYANAAGFAPVADRRNSPHPLDRWLRAEAQDLVNRMTQELDAYDLSATCAEVGQTIDALTNWYVRLSRPRFAAGAQWEDENDTDAPGDDVGGAAHDALATLYDVLLTVSQVLAPFCPYMSEAMYLNLIEQEHHSVHLTDWPEVRKLSKEEHEMLRKQRLLRRITSLGLHLRSQANVKVRQPLSTLFIALPPSEPQLAAEDLDLLSQELNVKRVEVVADPGTLGEAYALVDARKVGPRLGGRVQEVIKAGKAGDFAVNDDGSITVLDERLAGDEVTLQYRSREGTSVTSDRGVVVQLETAVSDALKLEGEARDLVRQVQRLRREAGLRFTDRIALTITGADDVLAAHGELVAQRLRAELGKSTGTPHNIDLEGRTVTVAFSSL